MVKKIDYAKLFTKRKDGRYMGYWQPKDRHGCPIGKRHPLYDRDPEELYKRLEAMDAEHIFIFEVVCDEWEKIHREVVKDRTWANYAPHVKELKKLYGTTDIRDITPADITQDLLSLKMKGYSRTVVNSRRCIWRSVFEFAISQRYILYSPAESVKNPKGLPQGKRTAPTDNQIRKIIAGGKTTEFAFIPFFLLCTGVRRTEALKRLKADIDLDSWEMKIPEAKTPSGIRTVPIIEPLREPLKAWMDAHPGKWLFPYIEYNKRQGTHMTDSNWETAWANYCTERGWTDEEGKPTLGAHNIRHGTATLLFESGVDVYTAKKILGHSKVTTTMEIYTELREQKEKQSIAKYGNYISKAFGSSQEALCV